MRRRRHTLIGVAGLALTAVLAAVAATWPRAPSTEIPGPARADVSGPSAIAVADVQLGRSVGLDKRIVDPADTFAPDDTIYASVVTAGEAAHVRLTTRWSHGGRVLAEVSQGIAPAGTTVSEFNVWKPRGWPTGEYEVQILVGDVPAASRRFAVR
jgi:hypothetical protein